MPTLLLLNGYRFFFFSNESGEPPHVHVEKDRHSAKYWLDSLTLARNHGFNARELRKIEGIITNHRSDFLRSWHGYFSSGT